MESSIAVISPIIEGWSRGDVILWLRQEIFLVDHITLDGVDGHEFLRLIENDAEQCGEGTLRGHGLSEEHINQIKESMLLLAQETQCHEKVLALRSGLEELSSMEGIDNEVISEVQADLAQVEALARDCHYTRTVRTKYIRDAVEVAEDAKLANLLSQQEATIAIELSLEDAVAQLDLEDVATREGDVEFVAANSQCAYCLEQKGHACTLPCGHEVCRECLSALFETAIADVTLLPARCCEFDIPTDILVSVLSPRKQLEYVNLLREKTSANKMYCPTPKCSMFIDLDTDPGPHKEFECAGCKVTICSTCKTPAHSPDSCDRHRQRVDISKLHRLASSKGWRLCSTCDAYVAKISGCNHMTCRCGNHFCYRCGSRSCYGC